MATITPEEARLRRLHLQEKMVMDARNQLTANVAYGFWGGLAALPLYRSRLLTTLVPEYNTLKLPIKFNTATGAFLHITKNEGLRRHWRGFFPMAAFLFPTVFAKQLSTLSFLHDLNNTPSSTGSIAKGFAVATLTGLVTTLFQPFLLAYTKMAADLRFPEYLSHAQTAANPLGIVPKRLVEEDEEGRKTLKTKKITSYTPYQNRNVVYTLKRLYVMGGAKNLFTGSLPAVLGLYAHFTTIFAFAGITHLLGLDRYTPLLATITSSALATIVVQPFEVVRNRMQYRVPMQLDYRLKPYSGMRDCFKHIWAQEGLRAFYRGSATSVGLFCTGLVTTSLAATLSNEWKRDKLRENYLAKVNQFTAAQREKAEKNMHREFLMHQDMGGAPPKV